MWFLKQYEDLYARKEISTYKVDALQRTLLEAKQKVADRQLHMVGCLESQVHALRMEMDINRVLNWLILVLPNLKPKHLITTLLLRLKLKKLMGLVM
jgi:carbamoyl-phosphate synthase large subunit